jgi:hypothetical protein
MSLVERKTLNEFSTNSNDAFFNQIFSAGSKVPHSGIYRCTQCKREVAVNDHDKDNKFLHTIRIQSLTVLVLNGSHM